MKNNTVTDCKIVVAWNEEDECYVASLPAFSGLATNGNTPGAAIAEARILLGKMLDLIAGQGRHAPSTDQPFGQDQVRAWLPFINVSKLAALTGIKRATLNSKLKRGTRFTPQESRMIHRVVDRVMA